MVNRPSPKSHSSRRATLPQPGIRPGVALVAVAFVALAVGLALLSFREAPSGNAATEARRAAARMQTGASADALPLRSRPGRRETEEASRPASSRSWAAAREPKRSAKTSPQATSAAPSEPQWDGKGQPSRDWLRWQLGTLVEQGHPEGSVSRAALDAAIDDALEARAARLEMEQAKDPETLVAAQERFERASQSLVANLGIESVDLSTF